jgi:hypothetical protein
MNYATAMMSDTWSAPARIAARIPSTATDMPPLVWIERSSRCASIRAINARQLCKVNPANTEVAELFQCDCDNTWVKHTTARSGSAPLATCFHRAAGMSESLQGHPTLPSGIVLSRAPFGSETGGSFDGRCSKADSQAGSGWLTIINRYSTDTGLRQR